ncbi:hypothetical protein BLNAU_7646 [Blattamonas nauphoetae]|uniref:Uncharacterized protein n=1 Tax=Blattamonas nauphoetae TaxID=2049346 RepID=A0ABQ9Y1F1_9EUKA|nr:hypothetical protein BLNAU_7646 [Blattamonas nauphoetae]
MCRHGKDHRTSDPTAPCSSQQNEKSKAIRSATTRSAACYLKLILKQETILMIYIDEIGWNARCIRRWGWGVQGQTMLIEAPPNNIQISVICAISEDGIHHAECLQGKVDAVMFESIILRHLASHPKNHSYGFSEMELYKHAQVAEEFLQGL